MNSIDLAYAAGFIDGEGCFRISKNGGVSIVVANTHKPTLDHLQTVLGGKVYPRSHMVIKPQYSLQVNGEECVHAVTALLPYLKEKRPQADVLLAYRAQPRGLRTPGRRGQFSSGNRQEYITAISDLKRI